MFDPETGERGPPCQLWIVRDRILGTRPVDAELPDGLAVIDATGATLLPGLFDLHAHTSVSGGPMSRWIMVPPEQNLAGDLYCGVTHVVDLHAVEAQVFELRDRSRDDPGMARLYAAGAAFTAPGGHPAQLGVPTHEVETPEQLDEHFDALSARRPDVVKGVYEHGGWGGLPEMPALDTRLLAQLAERAHDEGLRLFTHVWSLDEAQAAVEAGSDALVHGVYLGEVDEALIEAMRERGVGYVPTLSVVLGPLRAAGGQLPYDHDLSREALHPELLDVLLDPATGRDPTASWASRMTELDPALYLRNLKRLFDAGVPVGIGTDAGNPLTPHGPGVLYEIELFVEAGLTPAQALSAATLGSARVLGVDADFGALTEGRVADVVIVDGDPTADISALWNIRAVVKAGIPVDRAAIRERNERAAPGAAELLRAGLGVPEVVDDFSGEDLACGWGGRWQSFVDSVAGGDSTGRVAFVSDEEGQRLRVTGELKEGFEWGAWSGAVVDWSDGRTRLVDASEYDGLRLRVRGLERPYAFTVNRAAVKDFNVFTAPLTVTDEWTEVDVPFASLRQVGFGTPVEWGAHDVIGINVDARNNPFTGDVEFGPFALEIDSIRLYRDGE